MEIRASCFENVKYVHSSLRREHLTRTIMLRLDAKKLKFCQRKIERNQRFNGISCEGGNDGSSDDEFSSHDFPILPDDDLKRAINAALKNKNNELVKSFIAKTKNRLLTCGNPSGN